MKTALVTGGTGFIGSHIVKELVKNNYHVIVTGNNSENKLPPKVEILQPSFIGLDLKRLKKVDVVFHQAAINLTTSVDQKEMNRANVDSTIVLFKHCLEQGCKKFVYASSTAVYGDVEPPFKETATPKPLNAYGKSKFFMEQGIKILNEENPDATFVGLRYCNCYGSGEGHKGPRASMIYQLAKAMRQRPPKIFEFGQQKRDYIYVKDVVRANMLAAKHNKSIVLNCGSGVAVSFNELVSILNRVLKKSWEPIYIPNPYLESYQNHTLCDMSLAKKHLNFEPKYDIESGIKDYKKSGSL